MNSFEDSYVPPVNPESNTFRILSIIMCIMSLIVSVALLIFIAIVALFQTAWISKHGGHMGPMNLFVFLSCLGASAGAIMILTKVKAGLWVYLAGQALFLYVAANGVSLDPVNEWDELISFFALILIGATLFGCVLQTIFTLKSEI